MVIIIVLKNKYTLHKYYSPLSRSLPELSSKISFSTPVFIIKLLIFCLFNTTVNGACVFEKKQVVMGPNKG